MTYKQFETKWLGKRVDYDRVFGFQCVDLIKQYLHECYGLRPGAWGNAIDYWTKTHSGVLAKFSKVAGSNAKQGDIVVLNGTSSNSFGHIGVATGGLTGTAVEILEQNGGTGSGNGTGSNAIRKRYVPRSRVAGLLRSKQEVNVTDDQKLLSEPVFDVTWYRNRHPDLAKNGVNTNDKARTHWLRHGIKEGRQSHANFSVRHGYAANYGDLRKAFGTDYRRMALHWFNHGIKEGRHGIKHTPTVTVDKLQEFKDKLINFVKVN